MTIDTLTAITKGQLALWSLRKPPTPIQTSFHSVFLEARVPVAESFMFSSLPDAITGVPYNAQVQLSAEPRRSRSVSRAAVSRSLKGGGNLQINPATGVDCRQSRVPRQRVLHLPHYISVHFECYGFGRSRRVSSFQYSCVSSACGSHQHIASRSSKLNYLNTLSSFGGFPPITWQVAGLPSGLASGSNGIIKRRTNQQRRL